MFLCPKCNGRTEVYANKKDNEPYTLGRYRKCTVCGARYTTVERIKVADEEIYPSRTKCVREGYEKAMMAIAKFAQSKVKGEKEWIV